MGFGYHNIMAYIGIIGPYYTLLHAYYKLQDLYILYNAPYFQCREEISFSNTSTPPKSGPRILRKQKKDLIDRKKASYIRNFII